jgi:hypothetical protein
LLILSFQVFFVISEFRPMQLYTYFLMIAHFTISVTSTHRYSILLECKTTTISFSLSFSYQPAKHGPAALVTPVLHPINPSVAPNSLLVFSQRYLVNFSFYDLIAYVSCFCVFTTLLNISSYMHAYASKATSDAVEKLCLFIRPWGLSY